MADHVYHWKHGWIPLDHTAALSKAKGNHAAAKRMLADAHGPSAGINSRAHVAKAIRDLPNVPAGERTGPREAIKSAAALHGAQDLLPEALRREQHMREMQAEIVRSHEMARSSPEPSAGDLTDAVAKWKRDNPGKKVAGHEKEIDRIAREIARHKYVHTGSHADTAAQQAANRARVKAANSSRFNFPITRINV